jgi:hypothetical protein
MHQILACSDICLPPEIWTQIAQQLTKKDLCSLCQTSSYLLSVTRRELYRSVTVKTPQSAHNTVLLLASNPNLAACVTSLQLGVRCYHNDFLPVAFANMTSLTRLWMLNGFSFDTLADQQRFVDLIQTGTIPLRELVLLSALHGDDLSLPGLTTLVCGRGTGE